MKKVLMVASVVSMIEQFNMSNIAILQKLGCEVHVAANFEFGSTFPRNRVSEFQGELYEKGIKITQIDFDRNVLHIKNNIHAYRQIKKLIEENQYDIIHCHSPIGGVLTRLAAKNAKFFQGKVIYTAHGFHFYKGAPLKNWLIYYPIERWFARYTDVLITINQEDFVSAKKFSIRKGGKVTYVPGVGVDIEKIRNVKVNRVLKRTELGINMDNFVVLNIGEMIKRKNQKIILRAFAKLSNDKLSLLICGRGDQEAYLKNLAIKLGIEKKVIFAGFRSDINEILHVSDLFVFPSYQEGLSVALMQAMAAGLPSVCSKIRGNVDLIKDGENGYLINSNDIDGCCNAMKNLINNKNILLKMSKASEKQIEDFDIHNVEKQMEKIYMQFVN